MARISSPGNKSMTSTTAANGKEAAYHGVPAEADYGFAQAIKIGNTIHVSGQLSQDDKGTMIAPAALDDGRADAGDLCQRCKGPGTFRGQPRPRGGRNALCPRRR